MTSDAARIFEDNYLVIFRYCLRRVDNWHMAEDITSAVFECALTLLPHDHPRELLISIARYRVLRYWRTEHQRRTRVFTDVFDLTDDEERYPVLAIDGETDRIDENCDTAALATQLYAALETLSVCDRQIIMWRYVELLPAKEIAARLGMSADVYNQHQSRILYTMAKCMTPRPTCLLCDAPVKGRGVCRTHLEQARRGARIPLLSPIRVARSAARVCRECGAPAHLRGLCHAHYRRLRRQERKQVRQAVLK